jgi:hypothetical protein
LPSDRRHHSGNPKGASCFISVVDRSEDGTSPALRVPLARLSKERPRDQAPRGLFFLAVQHRNQHRSG